MSAIQQIIDRLRRRADLHYHVSGRTITVSPPSSRGFTVWLTEAPGEWTVGFDGWHEHFKSEEEALSCFAFGLSDRCRLQVRYRGSFPCRWTLEERTEDHWREVSTVGLLLFPFWRRLRIEYRQNTVIDPGTPERHNPATASDEER